MILCYEIEEAHGPRQILYSGDKETPSPGRSWQETVEYAFMIFGIVWVCYHRPAFFARPLVPVYAFTYKMTVRRTTRVVFVRELQVQG